MYRHILLAVALQPWDEFSPHAVAARDAVTLAHGSGAQLSVLSVYDYDDKQPEALSLSRDAEPLSRDAEPLIRGLSPLSGQMVRMDELMATRCRPSWPARRPTRPRSRRCSRWGIRASSSSPPPRRSGSTAWSLARIANAAFSMFSWAGRRRRSAATPLVPS